MELIDNIRLELGPRRIRRHYPTTIADPTPTQLDEGDADRLQRLCDQGRERLADWGHFEYVVEGVTPTLVSGSTSRYEILFSDSNFTTNPIRRVRWVGQEVGAPTGTADSVQRFRASEIDWGDTWPQKVICWEQRIDRIRLIGLSLNPTTVAYFGVPTEAELLARADWRQAAIAAAMSIAWEDIANRVTRDGVAQIAGMTPIRDNAEGLRKAARAAQMEYRRLVS